MSVARTELILYITPGEEYNGDVKVAVGGVSAHQLDETHTFTVTMAPGAVDITFAPLACVGGVLKESNVDVNRVGVTGMCFCCKAAEDHRAARNYS